MAVRDIYLKIETISGYSPVEPDDHVTPPIVYRRDCMRNMGTGRPSEERMRRPAEVPSPRRLLRAPFQDGRRSRQSAPSRDAPQASRAGTQVRLYASTRRADASYEPVARRRGSIRRRDESHAGAHSRVAWPGVHGDDWSDADANAWHGRDGRHGPRNGTARCARGAYSLHRHAGRARACAAALAASRAHACTCRSSFT